MIASLEDLTILSSKPLGEGGFSKVLKCLNKRDGRTYALKVVDVSRLTADDCDNLRLEIELHTQLRHKYIINFHDCLQVGNMVYILLEYAANGCLFFYIHPQNGLPEHVALRFFCQAASAVKHLHDNNLIHRDLKPENLLLDERFDVKLCDFGWSCRVASPEDYRTSICGTYEYMSPEILFEEGHSKKVDIWCLGVLLYELLHGAPPFQGASLEDMKNALTQRNIVIYSHFSNDTKQLFRCLLRKDPRKRPTIDEVLAQPALLAHLDELARPLSAADREVLQSNYLFNTNDATTHPLPFFAAESEAYAGRASVPMEFAAAEAPFDFVEVGEGSAIRRSPPRSAKAAPVPGLAELCEAGVPPPTAVDAEWATVAPRRLLIKLDSSVRGAENPAATSYRTFIRDNAEPGPPPNIVGDFKRKPPSDERGEERRSANVSRINLCDFDSGKIRLLSEMSPTALLSQSKAEKAKSDGFGAERSLAARSKSTEPTSQRNAEKGETPRAIIRINLSKIGVNSQL